MISVLFHLLSSPDEPTVVQPEWEYLEVILKRDTNASSGYGFSIAGGVDVPISDLDSGIYITRINANGVADLDGRLRLVPILICLEHAVLKMNKLN